MGVFFGNWYSQMLQARVDDRINDAVLDQAIAIYPKMEAFLQQQLTEQSDFQASIGQLQQLF